MPLPPHVPPHLSMGYHWPTPVTPTPDSVSRSSYPYTMLPGQQPMESTYPPPQSHAYVHAFQASSSSLYHYRSVSPALSHAPSQFSTSSHSQSSSGSDSPAPGPLSGIRTPFFSPTPLPVLLSNEGDAKYELESIREHDDGVDDVGLAPLDTLKRFHPYRRDPVDDRVVQSLGSRLCEWRNCARVRPLAVFVSCMHLGCSRMHVPRATRYLYVSGLFYEEARDAESTDERLQAVQGSAAINGLLQS
ncbi:hypothetical protein BC834DRAFT_655308 [Gloeopeniophorella convolvens]|nr:hypothetical protein BC834DRAFT_655308 [Gloeopeniophorella convolvens]